MATFSKQLVIPEALNIDDKSKTENYSKFTAEPYEKGYGQTIGNSLRRILLSSLEGAAVVAVRIKGARHEYAAINGVQEDVVNIVLNLKKLRVRLMGEGPETVMISLKGKKEVKASDIKENANVEIINKDLVIAHVESGAEFEAELEIARGYCVQGGVSGNGSGYQCSTDGNVWIAARSLSPASAIRKVDANCGGLDAIERSRSCGARIRFTPSSMEKANTTVESPKTVLLLYAPEVILTF